MTQLHGDVLKGWGSEHIFVSNDKYCGKLLKFNTDSKFSMHLHREKDETWYVLSGKFLVEWIDTGSAQTYNLNLLPADTFHVPPMMPHRLICLEEGVIVEVSTPDSVEDNYRVAPGDSQQPKD